MSLQSYIVVFKKNASKEAVENCKKEIVKANGEVTHEYGTVLNGFAAKIAPETFQLLTQSITGDGPIDYIEPDGVMTTQ